MNLRPVHLDLKRDEALTIEWDDGTRSILPVVLLRRMSPSAEMRELRAELERNPLTVLPANMSKSSGPLRIDDAQFVGNYALRLCFSDGHDTGLYTWAYLRSLDPDRPIPARPDPSLDHLRDDPPS